MILTGLKGEQHDIDALQVLFARPTARGTGEQGKTWIVWSTLTKVKEAIAVVGPGLEGENTVLKRFMLPNKTSIWINVKDAVGPIYMPPGFRVHGNKCWIGIGKSQFGLGNTQQEVADIIRSGGGKPEPIIEDD